VPVCAVLMGRDKEVRVSEITFSLENSFYCSQSLIRECQKKNPLHLEIPFMSSWIFHFFKLVPSSTPISRLEIK
jgi:hypothetical protein